MNTVHQPGLFDLDGIEGGPFLGWTSGTTWNGWACPLFEEGAAMRIAQGVAGLRYDEPTDTFVFVDPAYDDSLPEHFGNYDIATPGGLRHVYAIGTSCWTWVSLPAVQITYKKTQFARDRQLADELIATHPKHDDWEFDYAHPSLFTYVRGSLRVFFTPDYAECGTLCIQATDGDVDIHVPYDSVTYTEPLTSEFMFTEAVKLMNHFKEQPVVYKVNKESEHYAAGYARGMAGGTTELTHEPRTQDELDYAHGQAAGCRVRYITKGEPAPGDAGPAEVTVSKMVILELVPEGMRLVPTVAGVRYAKSLVDHDVTDAVDTGIEWWLKDLLAAYGWRLDHTERYPVIKSDSGDTAWVSASVDPVAHAALGHSTVWRRKGPVVVLPTDEGDDEPGGRTIIGVGALV